MTNRKRTTKYNDNRAQQKHMAVCQLANMDKGYSLFFYF